MPGEEATDGPEWPENLQAEGLVKPTQWLKQKLESGGGNGGAMDHEQLTNRPGVEEGEEAMHLSRGEWERVLALLENRPGRPRNLSPLEGAMDVYQFPRFVGSAYHHPDDVPMAAVNIRIATDAGLADIVLEDAVTTSQPSFLLPFFDAVIAPNTAYYWSIQYVDDDGNAGGSVATLFTTGMEFAGTVVLQPQIVMPYPESRIPSMNPLLISTPFMTKGCDGAVAHRDTRWQVADVPTFAETHILFIQPEYAEIAIIVKIAA